MPHILADAPASSHPPQLRTNRPGRVGLHRVRMAADVLRQRGERDRKCEEYAAGVHRVPAPRMPEARASCTREMAGLRVVRSGVGESTG
eukprot:362472-Chlamydomonas_euryale.AAC.2